MPKLSTARAETLYFLSKLSKTIGQHYGGQAMNKHDFVTIDADIMHGVPVFKGTRVPIETLFDYLATGDSIDEFLDNFPTVPKPLVEMALEYSKQALAA